MTRPVDIEKQVDHLEKKHAKLKERVAELDSRVYLTQHERLERQRLKKKKLAAKDALLAVRRVEN